jgi:hypothetical protein
MKKERKPREVDILMLDDLRELDIGEIEREYRFEPSRKWRLDFAIPTVKLAIEIEGGISKYQKFHPEWKTMRHQTGAGAASDCEKYANAVAQGWILFRFTSEMIKTGVSRFYLRKWKHHRYGVVDLLGA